MDKPPPQLSLRSRHHKSKRSRRSLRTSTTASLSWSNSVHKESIVCAIAGRCSRFKSKKRGRLVCSNAWLVTAASARCRLIFKERLPSAYPSTFNRSSSFCCNIRLCFVRSAFMQKGSRNSDRYMRKRQRTPETEVVVTVEDDGRQVDFDRVISSSQSVSEERYANWNPNCDPPLKSWRSDRQIRRRRTFSCRPRLSQHKPSC